MQNKCKTWRKKRHTLQTKCYEILYAAKIVYETHIAKIVLASFFFFEGIVLAGCLQLLLGGIMCFLIW